MDEETKGFDLKVLISLVVGVISLIVIIPTISMIMEKTKSTLEYVVKHSLDTSSFVEVDFVKTYDDVAGPARDVYTLISQEFKLIYYIPAGEPFSLTYTSDNYRFGLNLEVTTDITPITSLVYLNDLNLRYATSGVPGVARFNNVNDIGVPQNYVIEIIQIV